MQGTRGLIFSEVQFFPGGGGGGGGLQPPWPPPPGYVPEMLLPLPIFEKLDLLPFLRKRQYTVKFVMEFC